MKLRSLILTVATVVIAASSLSGCIVIPARGYVVGPPVIVHHGWGYDRDYDRH